MYFGEYLRTLRKEKNISQRTLSEKCGISNAEISRIENGQRQKPSPDVLRLIAPVLEVSYEDLMSKAGYLGESSSFIQENRCVEEKIIDILTPRLIKKGWNVSLSKQSSIGDILAIKDNAYWYIDFKFIYSNLKDNMDFRVKSQAKEMLLRQFGVISIFDQTPISKFTITVTDLDIFNYIKKYVPKKLNVKISVMLIDLVAPSIVDEHILI